MNDALQRFAGKGSHSLKVTKHLANAVLVDAITFAVDHQSLALESPWYTAITMLFFFG
uniref:Uncharacterized protein n=1 Tax=Pseudomonas fluorescens (strain SBW25) TaxID=216595 RepID=A0A0G4E5R3_PSEFS|nr:hypothetical protein PQBR55_0105 [Pseudomonas fluorescens SBW25]